jgi:hypothetical protein
MSHLQFEENDNLKKIENVFIENYA